MATKERDFCTILDKLVENKDVHEIAGLMYKHCLTSLITNPVSKRSFLAPSKKALGKLKGKSVNEIKKQIKMHVLGRMILPDQSFKDRVQLDVPTMLKGVKYEVSKAKTAKSIIVEGRECKLLDVTGNGALYVIDDLLPEKKVAETESKRGKKRVKSPVKRRRSKKQKGGFLPSHLSGLPGLEARFGFIDDYRGQYQAEWPMYALAHLLLYLQQGIGNFKEILLPFLGTDPMSTLELLLQLRDVPYDPTRLIIGEPEFTRFLSSPYYLSGDTGLLREAQDLMRSFCVGMDVPGMCPYDTYYIQETFVKQHRDYIASLLATSPAEARGRIMDIYRKLGDIDRYSPGQVALFRKIWERPGEGLLRNDLLRFVSKQISGLPWDTYNQSMNMLFGRPISDVLNIILQPELGMGLGGPGELGLGLGMGLGSEYRFPTEWVTDWLNGRDFLHAFPLDMYTPSPIGYTPFAMAPDIEAMPSYYQSTQMGVPGLGQYTKTEMRGDFRPSLSYGAMPYRPSLTPDVLSIF